jgi:hypothetical protein
MCLSRNPIREGKPLMAWFIETPKGTEEVPTSDHAFSGAFHEAEAGNLPVKVVFVGADGVRHEDVIHTESPTPPVHIGTIKIPREFLP